MHGAELVDQGLGFIGAAFVDFPYQCCGERSQPGDEYRGRKE